MIAPNRLFAFADLASADLIVDAVYRGGAHKNIKDDPIDPLVGGGNQGGFRYLGSPSQGSVRLCILYSDLADPDWPDTLDMERGTFSYYGDNKRLGHDLHGTRRAGNALLRQMLDDLHSGRRDSVPTILIFTKGTSGRDEYRPV